MKLFRFPISRLRAFRVHGFTRSRFTALGLLLTAYCLLLTFPGCGDDGNKDGDSSSSGSAKARVKIAWEEWAKKRCEISSVCRPEDFTKGFGTLEECRAIVDEDVARSGSSRHFLNQADTCYALFVDSYEACKTTVVTQEARNLCQYRGVTFYQSKTTQTIYDVFPECGAALKGVESAASDCDLNTATFVGAPLRNGW